LEFSLTKSIATFKAEQMVCQLKYHPTIAFCELKATISAIRLTFFVSTSKIKRIEPNFVSSRVLEFLQLDITWCACDWHRITNYRDIGT
jgi:hypothetical protein